MKKSIVIKSFDEYYEVVQKDIKVKLATDSEDMISCKVIAVEKITRKK